MCSGFMSVAMDAVKKLLQKMIDKHELAISIEEVEEEFLFSAGCWKTQEEALKILKVLCETAGGGKVLKPKWDKVYQRFHIKGGGKSE